MEPLSPYDFIASANILRASKVCFSNRGLSLAEMRSSANQCVFMCFSKAFNVNASSSFANMRITLPLSNYLRNENATTYLQYSSGFLADILTSEICRKVLGVSISAGTFT